MVVVVSGQNVGRECAPFDFERPTLRQCDRGLGFESDVGERRNEERINDKKYE